MTDISGIGMVSYYNPLAMYRQQQQQPSPQPQPLTQQVQPHTQAQQAAAAAAAAADGSQQYWYGYSHGHPHTTHHHQSTGPQQYLEHPDVLSGWPPHPHTHHYSHHLQYQHHQAYQQHQQHQQQQLQLQQQQQQQQQLQLQQQPQQQQPPPPQLTGVVTDWSGDESNNPGIIAGEPSPPITVSGSEISSPSTPSTPPSNNNNTITANNNDNNNTPMRPAQVRSPYEWMKKPSYQSQPNPACDLAATCDVNAVSALHDVCALDALGKTRTKDKYRVVYTDHQRLELEKEFHYSRYITIRRKSELANSLALSERQVKIWFQNRRAKERKQVRKREELEQKDRKADGTAGGMAIPPLGGMGGMLSGLMHNGNSPPLALGTTAHTLPLGHTAPVLHPHQVSHPHSVLGL